MTASDRRLAALLPAGKLDAGVGHTEIDVGPVRSRDRIASLDILRGFALLGILAVNIEDFAGPESLHDIPIGLSKPAFVGWHAHLDLVILAIKWLFIEGKMRAMFAMLFGAGAILLTERLEAAGWKNRAADVFLRRSMWLVCFGLIHGLLIWSGDILTQYGLCALLFVYPLRHVNARRLITVGLALWLIGGTFGLSRFVHASEAFAADAQVKAGLSALRSGQQPTPAERAAIAAEASARAKAGIETANAVREGRASYWNGLTTRAAGYLDFLFAIFRTCYILEVAGTIIFGMGIYKTGFLTGRWSPSTYAMCAIAGYAIAAPIILVGLWRADLDGFSAASVDGWIILPYTAEQCAGMLANASLLLFIVNAGCLRYATRCLENVGRTAFSNYILTSLICQSVFAWGSWHFYGSLEYYQYHYVVFAVWAVNLLVSALWLRWFAMGPLEWTWRALTYWTRPPFLTRPQ